MRFSALLTALFPHVFAQALYTRQSALRLPDAEGPRSGSFGNDENELTVLVAGESTTAGVGANHTDEALPAQLAQALADETGIRVHWRADGVTGCRLAAVRDRLREHPPAEDLVVIASGVNDTTGLTALKHWREQIRETARAAGARGAGVVFLAVPPMSHFTALPRPLRTLMGLRARALNAELDALAHSTGAFTFINWRIPLVPENLALDGYHPSVSGYRAMAIDCARRLVERLPM